MEKEVAIKLKQRAKRVTEHRKRQLEYLSTLQPNDPFVITNKHMLELSEQTTWDGAGLLSLTGVLWWDLMFLADATYPHTVGFTAKGGPDWDLAFMSAEMAGYFYVDPSTLRGNCNFSLQAVVGGLGEVSLSLYDMNWGQIGLFIGLAEGASLAVLSGSGTIQYN
ncbi:MAG: hypothetical protein RSA09_12710 [Acinetobacter sp.]